MTVSLPQQAHAARGSWVVGPQTGPRGPRPSDTAPQQCRPARASCPASPSPSAMPGRVGEGAPTAAGLVGQDAEGRPLEAVASRPALHFPASSPEGGLSAVSVTQPPWTHEDTHGAWSFSERSAVSRASEGLMLLFRWVNRGSGQEGAGPGLWSVIDRCFWPGTRLRRPVRLQHWPGLFASGFTVPSWPCQGGAGGGGGPGGSSAPRSTWHEADSGSGSAAGLLCDSGQAIRPVWGQFPCP